MDTASQRVAMSECKINIHSYLFLFYRLIVVKNFVCIFFLQKHPKKNQTFFSSETWMNYFISLKKFGAFSGLKSMCYYLHFCISVCVPDRFFLEY